MSEKKEPQSFSLVLADADGGLLNRQLSEEWQRLNDTLDDLSMLHDGAFKGEIVVKLKVENDHGKINIKADCNVKLPPKKYTGARFYRNEAGDLTTQDPRVVGDMFKQAREAKSAAAPKMAAK